VKTLEDLSNVLKELLKVLKNNENKHTEDVLYTAKETSKMLKSNVDYVHKLRKAGLLKFMKLGEFKCRKEELMRFLEWSEGKDLTDPFHVIDLVTGEECCYAA